MRKSEMNATQLEDRDTVIRTLTAAGWKDTSQGNWFERDLWAQHEATLEYNNGSMILRAALSVENRSIDTRIEDFGGGAIALSISYGEQLTTVLDTIISVQDTTTPETYQDSVQVLVQHCPEVYVLAGADGATWIRMVLDEHEGSATQNASRESFISHLASAGWKLEENVVERSESGDQVAEAVAEYTNDSLGMRLSYFRDGWMRLVFLGPGASTLLPLRLKWQGSADPVLEALIQVQDTLSADSYPAAITRLIDVTDLVLLESAQGLIRLSV